MHINTVKKDDKEYLSQYAAYPFSALFVIYPIIIQIQI